MTGAAGDRGRRRASGPAPVAEARPGETRSRAATAVAERPVSGAAASGAETIAPPQVAPERRRRRAAGPAGPVRRAPRGAQLPYLVVVAAGLAALAWIWHGGTQRTRGGTLAMGGALIVAALARLVLPEGRAGMLASRGRFIDVVTLAALALGLLVAGLMLPTPS